MLVDDGDAGYDLGCSAADRAASPPPRLLPQASSMRRDIRIDLGLQRLSQHPPRALPHDLIDQRRRAVLPALVARAAVSDYGEHGCTFPASVAAPGHCLRPRLDHREGTPLPGRSTGFKHCSDAHEVVASAAEISVPAVLMPSDAMCSWQVTGNTTFPDGPGRPMILASVQAVGHMAVLRYLPAAAAFAGRTAA